MKRPFDPLRLDVAAFAADHGELTGQWALSGLPRVAAAVPEEAPGDAREEPVRWQAVGESRARRGGEAETWLHLGADTAVWLQCQRCLQPMREPVAVERSYRFVRSEAEAEAEDVDSEEDVLVISRALDLRRLVEDELILALPLVPRHSVCPQPLPLPQEPTAAAEEEPAPNPFAALAALKRGKPSH